MKSIQKHGVLAIIALLIVLSGDVFMERFKKWTMSPDDYMIINAITIPNHAVGEDPLIVYDRTILRKFRSVWVARLYRIDETGASQICSGSGIGEYDPSIKLDEVRLYAWYMDTTNCHPLAGRYVVKTTWRGPPGMVIHNTSNVFEVLDPLAGE